MKTALITGASSGIGREITYILAKKGYSLILVARHGDKLEEVADFVHNKYKVQVVIKDCDVSDPDECRRLYEEARPYHIDILVNCAGVYAAGDFADADLGSELSMLDTNIKSVHVLMKLFLPEMSGRVDTYVLNIADAVGLKNCGPHAAAYQASKAYVVSLSLGVAKELKEAESPTVVTAACPGPVDTEFTAASGGDANVPKMSAKACAKAAVKGMFKGKSIVTPCRFFVNGIKLNVFFRTFKFFAAALVLAGMLAGAGSMCYATGADAADDTFSADGPVDGDEAEVQEGDILPISEPESLPVPSYTIPDDANLTYEEVEYKPVDHYDPGREPMNGKRISVSYKGLTYPAYYWQPGDMVVLQVSLADEDIPDFDELSQEDQDTWKAFLDDDYATPEEAYYAQMLPTYTFWFDFDKNKIVPFVEFDYGTSGKVVMMDYTEDQKYYLEELSPSFLKLPPFEFETYQFLSVNDDSCYHILSCMDQVGNVYLYQYDANGNACARVDVNTLIGLRYLAERTIALNEYIDKVHAYQDNIRKIIAGAIIFVVVILFAFIYLIFGRHKREIKEKDTDMPDTFDMNDIPDKARTAPKPQKAPQESPPKDKFSTRELDDLTRKYTSSDTANFKREVLSDLRGGKSGGGQPTNAAVPADETPLPVISLPEELLKAETKTAPLPSLSFEPEVYDDDEGDDYPVPDDIDESEILSEPVLPSQSHGPTISSDDLEKLTMKYTGNETELFKRDIMEGLSGAGFKPQLDDKDPTEGGLFYPGDTEFMRNMFRPDTTIEEDDDEDEDDIPAKPQKRRRAKEAEPLDEDEKPEAGWSVEMPLLHGKPETEGLDDNDVVDLNDL